MSRLLVSRRELTQCIYETRTQSRYDGRPSKLPDRRSRWSRALNPETRYAETVDGVFIAYQVLGEGPWTIVLICSPFASNV